MAESLFAPGLRFGIHAGQQHCDFPTYLELIQGAERLGLDWASVFDHFMPIPFGDPEGPCFEGPTLLAALAAHTTRLRLGIIVTGVTYRHPAVAANIAATIDHISGGRVEWGLGGAWFEGEHEQYGIEFPGIGQRLEMMGEAAQVLKLLWTERRASFQGRHFQLRDAMCEPKPLQRPRIPLWIGGNGERVSMRHAAAQADGWNTFLMPLPEFDHKLDVLRGHCADVGRDPAEIRLQVVLQAVLGETPAEAQEQLRARAAALGVAPQQLVEKGMFAGTPQQLVERLLPYARRGVEDFLLMARPPADWRTLELFAGQTVPGIRAAASPVR